MTKTPIDLVELRCELLAAVAADTQSQPGRPRTLAPVLVLGAALLLAVVVPPTRAEIADAVRAVINGGSLPGESLQAGALPDWLREVRFAPGGEPRVLAEAGGQTMLVFRQASGTLCFDFGGIGICDAPEKELFAGGPVSLFGPTTGPDADTRNAARLVIWGLALVSVQRVEVTFADAPPLSIPVHQAFGIDLDATADPETLIVYGPENVRLATLDLTWRWQRRPAL